MQANLAGFGAVEEEPVYCVPDIDTEFVPPISLREDTLREAFRRKATVSFLCHFENDLIHDTSILLPAPPAQQGFAASSLTPHLRADSCSHVRYAAFDVKWPAGVRFRYRLSEKVCSGLLPTATMALRYHRGEGEARFPHRRISVPSASLSAGQAFWSPSSAA